jgi:hypothetical protein
MIDLRRPTATMLGALALTAPLLCAVTVPASAHDEAPPSAPPMVQPSPHHCPTPITSPTIRLIHHGYEHDQATRCDVPLDL